MANKKLKMCFHDTKNVLKNSTLWFKNSWQNFWPGFKDLNLQHIWGHHSSAPTWRSITTIFKHHNIELRRGKLSQTKFQNTLFLKKCKFVKAIYLYQYQYQLITAKQTAGGSADRLLCFQLANLIYSVAHLKLNSSFLCCVWLHRCHAIDACSDLYS